MRVLNQSKHTVITEDLQEAVSFSNKLWGLLRKSNPRSLMFKTRWGIHTFFLKEPIDVLVLDNNFQVVRLGISVSPNRFFFWNPRYCVVIELPEGTITQTKTQVKDRIQLPLLRSVPGSPLRV